MNKIDALRTELKCREMVEGTNLNWWDVVTFDGNTSSSPWSFDYPLDQYEFAIHIIEGRPVFKGDELFMDGEKLTVVSKHPTCDSLQWVGDSVFGNEPSLLGMPACHWSWLPPKQETVMVELPIEVVEYYAKYRNYISIIFAEACQKALNNLEASK